FQGAVASKHRGHSGFGTNRPARQQPVRGDSRQKRDDPEHEIFHARRSHGMDNMQRPRRSNRSGIFPEQKQPSVRATIERMVIFPGLTSGAFLRMRTSFVRKVPFPSFPRKRESSLSDSGSPSLMRAWSE